MVVNCDAHNSAGVPCVNVMCNNITGKLQAVSHNIVSCKM